MELIKHSFAGLFFKEIQSSMMAVDYCKKWAFLFDTAVKQELLDYRHRDSILYLALLIAINIVAQPPSTSASITHCDGLLSCLNKLQP